MVIALNMVDLAARDGLTLDAAALSRELGVPVVATVAVRKRGIDGLRTALTDVLDGPAPTPEPAQELRALQTRARPEARAAIV